MSARLQTILKMPAKFQKDLFKLEGGVAHTMYVLTEGMEP